MAVAEGPAPAGRGVKVGVQFNGPGAEFGGAVGRDQEGTALFGALARFDLAGRFLSRGASEPGMVQPRWQPCYTLGSGEPQGF